LISTRIIAIYQVATLSKTQSKPDQEQSQALPQTGYIRLALLITFIPFSKSTIWRKSKAGTFPKSYKISDNITAWKAEEIHAWMNEKGLGA